MEIAQLAERLSALSHQTRLRVFRLLVQTGPQGLCAGEIACKLAIAPTTMSTHLAILGRAGLIHAERRGRSITYRLDASGVQALFVALVSDCCDGRPDLCGALATVADVAAGRTEP